MEAAFRRIVMNKYTTRVLQRYVERSVGKDPLVPRIVAVLQRLPRAVLKDFLEDSRFRLRMDDFVSGQGRTVWMASPESGGNGSRCVVLRPSLASCREEFAHYVIAHELAHAHLRNGSWGAIEEPEEAADALAGTWGFDRPVGDRAEWG